MPLNEFSLLERNGQTYVVNHDTGDMIGPITERNDRGIGFFQKRTKFPKRGLVMFDDWLLKLAKDDLTGLEVRVLACVLSYLQFENECKLTHKEIAQIIGSPRPRVTEALKRLVEKGYLTRRDNIHYLSLLVGWKGKVENYHAALRRAAG